MNAHDRRRAQAAAAPGEIDRVLANLSILVVDDEPGICDFLVHSLGPRCKRIEAAASAEQASQRLDAQHFDLVILDNVMTAYGDLDTAIHALRLGAADFVLKPFRANQILNAVERCIDQRYLRRENFRLKYERRADRPTASGRLVGNSPAIAAVRTAVEAAVRTAVEKVARTLVPVSFTGDSGTGKEIAARTLHALSNRADKPFVPVNCTSAAPDRLALELFGDIGAAHDGLLLHAAGGSLFLDEIAELPLSVQAMLLRVIDDNRLRPLGAEREIALNLCFIFSANVDLKAAVARGALRADLFHRINGFEIHLPRLRDRVGDIADLAALFIAQFARQLGVPALALPEAVVLTLARYDWPGNVRELRNLIERSMILGEFPAEFAATGGGAAPEPAESLNAVERRHILAVLEACGGNRAEAARRLGVSRKTIARKCAAWQG